MSLLKTALHQEHLNLKAKMCPFAGYDMPIQYSSVKDEVHAVRNGCGVFDVSHMGEFFVEGRDAVKFIDELITNDFSNAPTGKAVYSPLCREDGTVIDDLIVYKIKSDRVLVCVNASNIQKDWDWISSHSSNYEIKLTNYSEEYSLLALQGPKAEMIMKSLELITNENLEYYSVVEKTYLNSHVIIARTGYTGEDGFEIFGSHSLITDLWGKLLKMGVTPCGLASRDVLRLEVCYPLYGHELNDHLTPLDASLGWTVKKEKTQFIGKNSLINLKPKYQLIKLTLEKGIPREGYEVIDSQNNVIGQVTSGTMSVTLGKGIALCLIEKAKMPEDKNFKIKIRDNLYQATYSTKPFVTGGHK